MKSMVKFDIIRKIDESFRNGLHKLITPSCQKARLLDESVELNKNYSIFRALFEPFYDFRKTRDAYKTIEALDKNSLKNAKRLSYSLSLSFDAGRLAFYSWLAYTTASKISQYFNQETLVALNR